MDNVEVYSSDDVGQETAVVTKTTAVSDSFVEFDFGNETRGDANCEA